MSPSRHESVLERRRSLAARVYRLVNKPYYWYRPLQLARRAAASRDGDGEEQLLRTAWGSQLYCWPDPLGQAVARTGVYDLAVAEALARLTDRGDVAVDAGANVGLMSNLLAHAVGEGGRVIAFEPHPRVRDTLERNVHRWREVEQIAVVEVRAAALSDRSGTVELTVEPAVFEANKGTASVMGVSGSARGEVVESTRLEDEIRREVGTLKLDVEGHELEVLHGASSLLSGGMVRDIVLEEHRPVPTPVTALLEVHGYTLFGLVQGVRGPILCSAAEAYERKLWDPPALLATRDAARARERMERRGWICLRAGLD